MPACIRHPSRLPRTACGIACACACLCVAGLLALSACSDATAPGDVASEESPPSMDPGSFDPAAIGPGAFLPESAAVPDTPCILRPDGPPRSAGVTTYCRSFSFDPRTDP